MFYEAKVGDPAPVGKTVAHASEVGADQDKLDELRSLIKGRQPRFSNVIKILQNSIKQAQSC